MKTPFIITVIAIAGQVLLASPIISPLTGTNGESGHTDGTGDDATFNDPTGLTRDAQGNLFVCDARNHVIRKISPNGEVTTIAGEPGVFGAVDGTGNAARFHFPADVAISNVGDLYVVDSGNHCIRRITPTGVVTTLAGKLGDADDINQDFGKNTIFIARALDGNGTAARFNLPSGIVHLSGTLYVSDSGNHTIRKVGLDGNVTTLAGLAGEWGHADGTGTSARFNNPLGICVGADGNLYVADSENHCIRCVSPAGAVTTFSGNPAEAGCQEGTALEARYSSPVDITKHPEGGFIVCESFANALMKIDANGNVSIFAGRGDTTTQTNTNTLSSPSAAFCDDLGNVYVTDTFNQEVRLVIAKFDTNVSRTAQGLQLTITWDSIPGRDYQLQLLGENGWVNAPQAPVRASAASSSISFPMPQASKGIYRFLLLSF
jgi:sugar lactone lactonase YvrE